VHSLLQGLLSGLFKSDQLRHVLVTTMWILLFILAIIIVLGSAMLLLRSARIPKLPDKVKARPYGDDDVGC